ncbi:hypothetical protein NEFER03_1280 [Nematocida sp. LUAm3]|nr:hypothetical protein NEFER03_1280 [Nematocida sp. LUAm3]KAI5174098.1 hypothetical protein NEFER02_0565 [Nematocida sp. LUAm2]KAI5177159.1 hypothetical protein NEFER01_0434 [Nematocida sp. LUAm1]
MEKNTKRTIRGAYRTVFWVSLIFLIYWMSVQRPIRIIPKKQLVKSSSLVVISEEEALRVHRDCKACKISKRCLKEWIYASAQNLVDGTEPIDVFLHTPYDIDIIFKYEITTPIYYAGDFEKKEKKSKISLIKVYQIAQYILIENIKAIDRRLCALSSFSKKIIGTALVLICYAFVLLFRKHLIWNDWSIGKKLFIPKKILF